MKKQYFGGERDEVREGLEEQGYTEATLREDIRSQLLSEKIFDEGHEAT